MRLNVETIYRCAASPVNKCPGYQRRSDPCCLVCALQDECAYSVNRTCTHPDAGNALAEELADLRVTLERACKDRDTCCEDLDRVCYKRAELVRDLDAAKKELAGLKASLEQACRERDEAARTISNLVRRTKDLRP